MKAILEQIYINKDRQDGHLRTEALAAAFLDALQNTELTRIRADTIWTALQNTYYRVEAKPPFDEYNSNKIEFEELLERINSIRQGWAKSSGTAFEYFLSRRYDPILQNSTPMVRLLLKSDRMLKELNPTNLGVHDLGSDRVDDLYLIVRNNNAWIIFCMVSAQASGGDRWLRAEDRCSTLRRDGIACINMTLDPRDINRSPHGNLTQPSYLCKFQSPNPTFNAHFIINHVDAQIEIPSKVSIQGISSHLDLPSRLFRTDVRNPNDMFKVKTLEVARRFIEGGNSLNSAHRW